MYTIHNHHRRVIERRHWPHDSFTLFCSIIIPVFHFSNSLFVLNEITVIYNSDRHGSRRQGHPPPNVLLERNFLGCFTLPLASSFLATSSKILGGNGIFIRENARTNG